MIDKLPGGLELERVPARAVGPTIAGPVASAPVGVVALAVALVTSGAVAVGAVAVGRLVIGRAIVRELQAQKVHIASLAVDELRIAGRQWTQTSQAEAGAR